MSDCRPQKGILVIPRTPVLALLIASLALSAATVWGDPALPNSPDGSATVMLFASAPDIVTPIGATIDAKGRLLVIESNTHFRPGDYTGPRSDRIRLVEAGHVTTLYEGMSLMMNLVAEADGSIVVSSRNEIFRLSDFDGQGGARKVSLATLQTEANYPHNGLNGLAIAEDGSVHFGIGENFAGAYTLTGADGRKISDNTGTGCIFRVDRKGHDLVRMNRGFWNPFGLGFDPQGNLWCVDNDPDGRPPSRLIHAVPGGDFGYEYRYGRTGLHPLQAWDGELPGTLGMVSGIGEAPVAVVSHAGRLYVSSWRDHQVEVYTPKPRGATFTTTMTPLLVGPESFRPTGLAFGPDGSLYVNDWGSSSYPVNHKGCIWKVTYKQPIAAVPHLITDAEEHALQLRHSSDVEGLLSALNSDSPGMAQAAQFGLSQLPDVEKIEWAALNTPNRKIGLMAAMLLRGADATPLALAAMKDADDRVRQMGVRAVARQQIKAARPALDELLKSQVLSPRLLGMTIATINQLDGDPAAKIDSGRINAVLLARLNAAGSSDQDKASALHMMQAGHPPLSLEQLATALKSPSPELQLEAVRYLNADSAAGRFTMLAQTAGDEKVAPAVRAEAVVGLSADAAGQAGLLVGLVGSKDAAVRHEALRSLVPIGASLTAAQRAQIGKDSTDDDMVGRLAGKPPDQHPADDDLIAWQKLLDAAPGDADAGRRIFFHPAGPGCFRCHMIEGRGRAIGPDLTMIGHSQTSAHVLESILQPSKEIAPLFTLWTITTNTGQRIDGMLLRRDGQADEVYVDPSGQETHVKENSIVGRKIRPESLMPNGLVKAMTDQELRDVVAFLLQKR